MKTITFILAIGFLSFFNQANGQSPYFYYYRGDKIYLNLDRSHFTLITEDNFNKNEIKDPLMRAIQLKHGYDDSSYKYANIQLSEALDKDLYFQKLDSINALPNVIKANPNFTNTKGDELGLSQYLYVKLKDEGDFQMLQNEAKVRNITIVEKNRFMPLWVTLKVTKLTAGNTLEVANELFETGLFSAVQPDFLSDDLLNCSNDPMFDDLWGLENTSYPDVDLNICQAWSINQGAGSVVAVLDVGIDKMHNDLSANIFPLSFDSETGTSPSQLFGSHGTHCAGSIAAVKDNNLQVVGVAPSAKLMAVSNSLASTPNSRQKRADGIIWAWQNGADVISNSWGSSVHYQVIDDAIQDALQNGRDGKGTIIVFASGNDYGGVSYPANANPDILAVGAISQNGSRAPFSNYGNELDVVAPGVDILSTLPNNQIGYSDGTSMATPHVAGVAALVLAENPCLGYKQVEDIIESTAQKLPGYNYSEHSDKQNGTWESETGYGLVDAHKAVKAAQELYDPNLDMYIKDVPEDFGSEPASYDNSTPLWVSSDIWTRNHDDHIEQHENLEYDPNNPGFVYVRIRNKSCQDLQANKATVHAYFAKAGTFWANWPFPWTNIGGNPPVGGEIGSVSIPAIPAGGERVISIPWYFVPNPQWYGSWPMNEIHHFCILARIVSNDDPMYSELTGNSTNNVLSHNISYNNNVAMKNVSIVDFQQFRVDIGKWVLNDHAAVKVGNALTTKLNSARLRFAIPAGEYGDPITKEAEVRIILDSTIWNIWQSGGAKGTGVRVFDTNNHELLVMGPEAELINLNFPSQTLGNVAIQFNFLTEEQDGKNNFTYDLTQLNDTGAVLGGERFQIVRPSRKETEMFEAGIEQSGALQTLNGASLTAQDISEPAVYRWYSSDTTLIDTGRTIVLNSNQPTPALLSVTSDTDGYMDYTVLNISPMLNGNVSTLISQPVADSLVSLSPNPATSQVVVQYHIGSSNVQSAQLKVTYVNNPTVLQVANINASQSQKSLNIGSYAAGVYIISLYVDGQQRDSRQLIIQ